MRTHGRMTAAQRREQILDAAKEIALRSGFHEISIEGAAREAGITRPVVYGHFGDLAGLLDALVERESLRALGQLSALMPPTFDTDPKGALAAALRGYLEAVQADPATWRLVLMPPEGAPRVLRERIEAGRAAVVEQLARAVEVGALRSPDPELTAHSLSAVSDAGARLLLTDPDSFPVERIMDHADWVLGLLLRP